MKQFIIVKVLIFFTCVNAKEKHHCSEYVNCKPIKTILSFDLKGDVKTLTEVMSRKFPYDTTESYDTTVVTEFDRLGFVTKKEDSVYVFNYDKNGLLSTVSCKEILCTLTYNENGLLENYYRIFRGAQQLLESKKYSYDSRDRITTVASEEYEYSHNYIENYFYADDGSFIVVKPKDNNIYNDTLQYDKKGLLTKRIEYSISLLSKSSIGNSSNTLKPVPQITNFEYISFDSKGNWTERIERAYKNGKEVYMTFRRNKRKIIYY